MTAKTKARDIIPGWPRGKSTSAFTGVRYYDSVNGFRYREMRLPWNNQKGTPTSEYTDWLQQFIVTPDFRRTTEAALESAYRAGQNEMVDNYRARYRTLTDDDLNWLRCADDNPLRDAIKLVFYRQYLGGSLPLESLVALRRASENDTVFWHRFRLAQV